MSSEISRAAGLPDPETHRPCIRCRQWLERAEGDFVRPEASGPISRLKQGLDSAIGDETDLKFICYKCQTRATRRKVILYGTFGAIVGFILLAQWLGWIE